MNNIYIVVALLILAGCNGSPVSAVKDSYIDNAKTMTASQLLDNRKLCDKREWRSFEDQHKRTIVEYKCSFVNTNDFLAAKRDAFIKNTTIEINNRVAGFEEKIKSHNDKIADIASNGKQRIEDKYNNAIAAPIKIPSYYSKLAAASKDFKRFDQKYNEKDYIDFLTSKDLQFSLEILRGSNLTSESKTAVNEFFKVLMHFAWITRENAAAGFEKYKDSDKYLKSIYGRTKYLIAAFDEAIAKEDAEIEGKRAEFIANENRRKEEALASLVTDTEKYKLEIEELNKLIPIERGKLENLAAEANAKFQRFDGIVESFQWIVNKENYPMITYGDISAISKNESSDALLIKHRDPERALFLVSKVDTDNYEAYLREVSNFNFRVFLDDAR